MSAVSIGVACKAVPMESGTATLSARFRREAGRRRTGGGERAGSIPPDGSRRNRPALSRVGRRAGAGGGQERDGALASGERGGAEVTWRVSIGPHGG
jgi:hypothetical protein